MMNHLTTSLAVVGLATLVAAAVIGDKRPASALPAAAGADEVSNPDTSPARTHAIERGADGFSPAELIIGEGDTVEFTMADPEGTFFWPASDFHPTHGIYREFDPGKPIPGDQSWQFTFNRTGSWGYHDHVAPYFTGRIVVRAKTAAAGGTARDGCKSLDASRPAACWNLMLARALKAGGTAGAFRVLIHLYKTEPAFIADGCHRQAHIIGEAAYAEYRKHRDWSRVGFGPETIYCNYGYYHGIFEHLFRDHPSDLHLIEALCAELEQQLAERIPLIRRNCYHGAGHGFMADPPPRSTWDKPLEMLRPALRACEALTVRSPSETQECLQGAYNVMADWMNFRKYGLAMAENPLDFCREQDEREHALACYYEYAMRIHDLAANDIVAIADRFVNSIADDTIARMVINSAASTVIESTLGRERYDDYIIACRSLAPRLREPCLNGILGGLVAHGEPGREHEKVLRLCASPILVAGERSFCYRNAFGKFRQVYLTDEIERLCAAIPSSYRELCSKP